MIAIRSLATARHQPERTELVPLVERAGLIELLRVAFVVAVIAVCTFVPSLTSAHRGVLLASSLGYLALGVVPQMLPRVGGRGIVAAIGGALLLDGLYLAWVMSITGGTGSPLFPLVLVHVVATTLAASYRTGLKVALWHTLLYLLLFEATVANVYTTTGGLASSGGLSGSAARVVVVVRVAALWLAALVTAAFAAFAERELRAQKIDLQHLSDVVSDMERLREPDSIAGSFIERMQRVFGFSRGVLLASSTDRPMLLASFGATGSDVPASPADIDGVVGRVWSTGEPALVRTLDADVDERLSALLPGARNVLVAPLMADGGRCFGVLALEHPRSDHLKSWVVDLVRQFTSHAAMRLQHAWLLERIEAQVREIGLLRDEVVEQNGLLETRVSEQTHELRTMVSELQEANDHRQRLLSYLVEAQEEERRRIAGDVHDDPVQRVIALSMRLQLLRRSITDPSMLEELDLSLESATTCIRSMRNLLFELRPPVLDERGVGAAIEEYLKGRDVDFRFRIEDAVTDQPPSEIRIVLYRIAQEALANVCKHAQASTVVVRIEAHDGGISVEIDDDGVGFGSGASASGREPGHMGLSSMRERAELAGGSCEIHSLPGEGTSVRYWVPVSAPAKERVPAPLGVLA
jgi:signal transduction histidine kinase